MTFDFSTFGAILIGKGLQTSLTKTSFVALNGVADVVKVRVHLLGLQDVCYRKEQSVGFGCVFEHPASPFFCLLQTE